MNKEWEWVTNEFEDRAKVIRDKNWHVIMGDPKETEEYTVEQLKSFGMRGVYRKDPNSEIIYPPTKK